MKNWKNVLEEFLKEYKEKEYVIGATLFGSYAILKELINNYYYKNKIATIPFTKIEKVYRNMNYREKYHLKNMPNQEFIELSIVNSIGEQRDMDQK